MEGGEWFKKMPVYAWCYKGQIEPIFSRTRELVARHAQLLKRRAAAQLRRDVAWWVCGRGCVLQCVGLVLHKSKRTSELILLQRESLQLGQLPQVTRDRACSGRERSSIN